MPRKLRVEYRTIESFRTEYVQNISKGGIFVPTRQPVAMRARVELELVLAFSDQSVVLPGEVVHCIPPDMAGAGAQPGVAIQFLLDGDELRGKLDAFSGPVVTAVDEREQGTGRRVAPRLRAHVPAELEIGGESIVAHTRNISSTGALIELPCEVPELGRRLKMRIKLPAGRDQMKVAAQVARHVNAGAVACVGVQFQVPEARLDDVSAFVARVRAVEHSRRLGGINGPIADLGIRSVLTMFGGNTPEGMLTLSRGEEEGYILIDHGTLRAQLGMASGREALDQLLAWTDGSFSFEGQVDETLVVGDQIPVATLDPNFDPAFDPPFDSSAESELPPAPDEEEELILIDLDELAPEIAEQAASADADAGADAGIGEEAAETVDGFVPDGDHSLGEFVLDDDEADAIEASLRVETATIDTEASLVAVGDPDRAELGKTEEALLDLAAAGLTVGKAVEIIPEPADQVYAALRNLLDEGFLTLD